VALIKYAPANVKRAGNLSHGLLDTWLELLAAFNIPVVVVFDQLEDYLLSPHPEEERANRRYFTGAVSRFINELKHTCIIIFAEEGFWTDLLTHTDAFASERLRQPFALAGRPAKPFILMPGRISPDIVIRLIQQRLRFGFPELDLTGLPPAFPFREADLSQLANEPSIRSCLRRLAKRYDEIVYTAPQPRTDVGQKLLELWKQRIAAAAAEHGSEMNFRVSFIPEVQNALQGWLECLERIGLPNPGAWQKVEMLTDPKKEVYGYLNVIRDAGLHSPGIGIAAWLGTRRAHAFDLRQRVGFFDMNPCPIRTLVMLRADGEDALRGEAKAVYDKAIKSRHDLRIQKYEPKDLHALMAFAAWHQAALAEVDAAKETDPDAEGAFRRFLGDLSRDLLGWIEAWRQPGATNAGVF
jgi:hypothetical protein